MLAYKHQSVWPEDGNGLDDFAAVVAAVQASKGINKMIHQLNTRSLIK